MIAKTYEVQCKKCKGKSRLNIGDDNRVQYIETTPIIASRFRKDLAWGFECICGNDTRMCREEFDDAPMLLKGSSGEVMARVIDSMRQTTDDSFIMKEL